MSRPRKYSEELLERAVRLALDSVPFECGKSRLIRAKSRAAESSWRVAIDDQSGLVFESDDLFDGSGEGAEFNCVARVGPRVEQQSAGRDNLTVSAHLVGVRGCHVRIMPARNGRRASVRAENDGRRPSTVYAAGLVDHPVGSAPWRGETRPSRAVRADTTSRGHETTPQPMKNAKRCSVVRIDGSG